MSELLKYSCSSLDICVDRKEICIRKSSFPTSRDAVGLLGQTPLNVSRSTFTAVPERKPSSWKRCAERRSSMRRRSVARWAGRKLGHIKSTLGSGAAASTYRRSSGVNVAVFNGRATGAVKRGVSPCGLYHATKPGFASGATTADGEQGVTPITFAAPVERFSTFHAEKNIQ